ncbi:GTF3A family protein [Megaselia abdita]
MPPDADTTSEIEFYTESEIEFKPIDEVEYFSSDIQEFRKSLALNNDSEIDSSSVKKSSTRIHKRKYVCETCSETFGRKTQYDRHIFKHNGIKTHKCSDCEKEYIISSALKRHILTFHKGIRGEKTFKCPAPSCDKAFDSAFNLERHSKRRHENPLTYKCDQCQSEFRRKIKLKYHVISVHTKEYPFKCEKCGKQFITENFFKKHNCKTYICDVCQGYFEKWTQLCEHKRTSSTCALKYKCRECGKEFKIPSLLRDHEEVHKPLEERKGFNCSFEDCDKFYTMKKNLDAHFRRKHGDLKEAFKCHHCDKILSTKKKLEDHIKVKHTHVQIYVKKAGPRNQRKDKGKKRALLSSLTGLVIPSDVKKRVLEGDSVVVSESE